MEKLTICFFIFLASFSIGYCENSKVDKLHELLSHSEGEERVRILHELILELWLTNPVKAEEYAFNSIELSKKLNNKELQSISLRLLGGVYTYKGNYDLSLSYTMNSLELAYQTADTVIISSALNNLGFIHYNLGNYSEAFDNCYRALKLKRKIKPDYSLSYVLNNVGLIHLKFKEFNTAENYFTEALELSRAINDMNTLAYSLSNVGHTYLAQDKFTEAENYFKQSAEIAKKYNYKKWQAMAYSGLGKTYFHTESAAISKAQFMQALHLREEIKDLKGISEIYYYLSKMNSISSELDSAFYYLNISHDIASQIQAKDRLLENYDLYKKIYFQKKQFDSAFFFQNLYVNLREAQFEENSRRSINGIELEVRQEETINELAIKELQLQQKSLQANFIALIAALVLIFALIIFTYYLKQKKLGKDLARKNQKINLQKYEIVLQNNKLNAINAEKNNIISVVAHDLKNPLNNIIALTDVIKLTHERDNSKTQEYLGMIKDSSYRLINMVTKILNTEEIEAQGTKLNLEKVNLARVIESTIDRFKLEASNKKIHIHSSINEQAIIEADHSYVEQIMENLLSNAIKFSPIDKSIFIKLSVQGSKAVCMIKDQGQGLSESDISKLFVRYQKLSATPTGNETSTGLGLSIVKKYIDAMNGKIWVESAKGKGASFFVSFEIAN
ncbi:hypothetical protein GCM10011506_13040 [Marivirga lumbricoides]|uniref:histidine kinase n=1 Tax=Marivirga lumbricoides TaxID=1046115 RepID=A0ABQ1LSH5_9BACT|nr:hypothetical protein GCM10011506_13040 [Marivirga lumbricoides]